MWKSKVWENKKFRLLVLLEIILLAVGIAGLIPGNRVVEDESTMEIILTGGEYLEEQGGWYIDGGYGYNGTFLTAVPGRLRPGVYELRIVLEANDNEVSSFGIESVSGEFYGLLSNRVSVYGGAGEQTCQFYVLGTAEEARITVNYSGMQPLLVKSIELVHTNAGSRIFIFLVLAVSALVNTLFMLYCYMGSYPAALEKKLVWFGIPALAVLASLPLFVDYMIIGADAIFHWMRIEALAQSISQGNIPARIEALWLYGHGYANSIFYCDTLLTIPALLRLIGFDMNVAYGIYVFAVNLATALIAYFCFKGCFKSRYIGMFGSMLYTLAPYRIYNIYNRSAVGEYTAMTFLPLLIYGFYLIFTGDIEEKKYKRYWLLPVLGFSGIIQSHVLTCEIAGIFTILLCLIRLKKVFRRQTFLELVKVVLGTIVLNLWYLVPFLDMTVSGEYYFARNSGNTIQERGALPAHFFYTMQAAGSNSRFQEKGLLETEPIGVGMAVLLGVAAFWLVRRFLRDKKDEKQDRAAIVAFAVGVVALLVSTSYFPWNVIQSWNKITGMLVPMLQFPTRLTLVAVVCMTFVACAGAAWMLKCEKPVWKYSFFVILCGAAVLFSMYQTNDTLMKKSGLIRLYSVEAMGHSGVLGAEYLPEDTQLPLSYHDAVPSEGVTVTAYKKENLDTVTELTVENGNGEYYFELPMLLYKGYRAQDTETGERFEVTAGDNHVVRVALPAGYSGTVRTWYAGMWYWRVSEVISLLFLLFIAVSCAREKCGAKRQHSHS